MTPTLPAKRYTDDQILEALTLSAKQTAREAAEQLDIPLGTIRTWAKGTHRDRYLTLRDQYAGQEQKEIAAGHADNAKLALEKQREAIEMIDLETLKRRPDTLAATAANLGKVASSATDKMQLLRDKPTAVVGHVKTVDELDASFSQRFGAKWDVESTAEELPA